MVITSKITWSENKKKFVINLKEDGHTIPQIQEEFFKRFDIHPTPDAIKGVISRYYGIDNRGQNNKSLKSVKAKWFKEPTPTNFTVGLADMERGMCYYTQDEGSDMKLCGEPVVKGYSYCEECCHIAYNNFGYKRSLHVKPFGLVTERKAG